MNTFFIFWVISDPCSHGSWFGFPSLNDPQTYARFSCLWKTFKFKFVNVVREIFKKKLGKSGQADPRSGQENVKISRQVVIFGVILPFYNGQNGSKFSQNRSGQAGGGGPPPPSKADSLTAFFQFFFLILPLRSLNSLKISPNSKPVQDWNLFCSASALLFPSARPPVPRRFLMLHLRERQNF